MDKLKHILLPSDFSKCATAATAFGLYLARKGGSKVSLLHVSKVFEDDPVSSGAFSKMGLYNAPDPHVREQMESQLSHFEVEGLELNLVQTHGLTAGEALADYAEKHEVDLIVMGTHGRRGFKRWLLGSVAEEVVRRAPCPVLSVKEQWTEKPENIRRILAPIDFSPASRVALHGARHLASLLGATLQILHVVQSPPYPEIYNYASAEDFFEEAKSNSLDVLQELLEEPGAECGTELHVLFGHPSREIVKFAEENQSHMILMAHLGMSDLTERVLGSVTEYVVRGAACPVLTADIGH